MPIEASVMWMPFFLSLLTFIQAAAEGTPRSPREGVEAVFERASKESDLDGAGMILASMLSDEAMMRSAFSTSVVLSESSVYIFFGGNWGSRAAVTRELSAHWSRVLVDSVSAKPLLIRSVIRADRYEANITRRHPRGSESGYPFFSGPRYADDLAEHFIERLRKVTNRPPTAVLLFDHVVRTADEEELRLLATWQMLCGLCDRLELIDKATTKNWRRRFPDLDKWFREHRPYIVWDENKSCIAIDEEATQWAWPTERGLRSIPDLTPPWLSRTR
jgi:hypothetical protein